MLRRLILIAVGAVLLVAAVAAGAVYWLVSGDGIRLALEKQASAWLEQPVRIGTVSAQLIPRIGIQLNNVRVGEPARISLAEVELSTVLRALLSRRIVDAELRIANSRLELPLPFALPASGESASDASQSGNSIRIESIRSIVLDDVTVSSRGYEIRVSADSALAGNRLELQGLTADSGRTSIRAEGLIDLEPRIDAKIRLSANRLDLDELLALADAFTPETRGSSRSGGAPARIAARVSAETATAGGVTISQLATDLQVEGDRVALSPLTFQLFGGRYQGSLNATLGTRLSVTLRSRLSDLDAAQIAVFGSAPDSVTGRLTGAGTFSGSGRDFAEVLSNAEGNGTAQLVDGTIHRLNLVRTVVLFFGRPAPDAAPASDRFDRIDLKFSLRDQVFHADALSLRSPDADMVGTGMLTVPTKGLNGTVDVSLSEELSAQAGTDLYRYTREGKRIVLPANLGGTMTDPRITINASAALKRGLQNEVGRRLGGLLDRFKREQ